MLGTGLRNILSCLLQLLLQQSFFLLEVRKESKSFVFLFVWQFCSGCSPCVSHAAVRWARQRSRLITTHPLTSCTWGLFQTMNGMSSGRHLGRRKGTPFWPRWVYSFLWGSWRKYMRRTLPGEQALGHSVTGPGTTIYDSLGVASIMWQSLLFRPVRGLWLISKFLIFSLFPIKWHDSARKDG